MYFKRIEMQGFKSFADPVAIDLNEGITCIIGPNGSGKSNISDALRWVLGEQSSKQLRGSKMQDVIFAGTATRKPKGMAEVTLVIDNTTGLLPLEYREVAVTRRMFRSGESEYLINGNQCRLRDIRELFMDTGIGVEGYSIIGQGRIADMVSSKAEIRRQIFEEAAGVVLYKTRKAEAENKLRSAGDDLERVRDIIAEIEGRIGGLREDSEKASEFLVLRDRYKTLSINLILNNLDNLNASLEAGTAELQELEDRLGEDSRIIDEADSSLEETRLLDAELSEKYSDANTALLKVIDELNTIKSGGELNKEKLSGIERELSRLSADAENAEEKLTAERKELLKLEELDRSMNSEKTSVALELDKAIALYDEHNQKASALEAEINRLKENMISIGNQNVQRKAEINTLSGYMQTLADRKAAILTESEGRDGTDSANRLNLERLEKEISLREEEVAGARSELHDLTAEIGRSAAGISDINRKLEELSVLSNRAVARKSTIEEMEANYEGYNNSVRFLMQNNEEGLIGTVSDILKVPEGYETAVETALGASLQNVICRRDSDAKAAIRRLKRGKGGRATFLPIESIKADRLAVPDRTARSEGFLGRASDMVSSDDEYRNIVDYLLCRVLIADTMDNAVRMSKGMPGGFRIVTLEGEVLTAFGSITGGRYANRTANLLDRKKEIASLNNTVREYGDRIAELRAELEAAHELSEKLGEELELKRRRLSEAEIAFNVLKADRDHAEELVKSDEGAAVRSREETESITEDIERASEMIENYAERIAQSEREFEAAEAEAERLMNELEELRPVLESDSESIVALRVRLGENESKILARNEMIERIRDSVLELEAVLDDCRSAAEELENRKSGLLSHGERSEDRISELDIHRQQLESDIAELLGRLSENRSRSEALMKEQKEVRERIEKSRDEKYRLEVKTARSETLIDAQKDKLWDEFEISYAEALDLRTPGFAIAAGNRELREIRLRMSELGDVNISAIEEYKSVSKRYEFMSAQESDITKAMSELNDIITGMDRTIKRKFKENFDRVVVNFEEAFRELFGGGYAELRLEDETKPLESGIEITAQPPGKKLKNINLLSGGEKTLTAIALMCAVLKAKPTPFVILDEVEAALDEVNIERFSDYLRKFDNIQFALITHQKATMEHADVLYGVTMPEQGISRMLSLRLGDRFDEEGLE